VGPHDPLEGGEYLASPGDGRGITTDGDSVLLRAFGMFQLMLSGDGGQQVWEFAPVEGLPVRSTTPMLAGNPVRLRHEGCRRQQGRDLRRIQSKLRPHPPPPP
jgi:hypothetical protein